MVSRYQIFSIICVILVTGTSTSFAQSRVSSSDIVRQRYAERELLRNPYWDGFILKYEGNCEDATRKLYPIAALGLGYEEAQTALGECFLSLAGLSDDQSPAPARDVIFAKQAFQNGLDWILVAASSGGFKAQGVLVALYAADLGPDRDPVEAAKWAHLYLTNATRLNLGAPVLAAGAIDALEAQLDRETWLAGKERARDWTPVFPSPSKSTSNSLKKPVTKKP